MSMSRLSATLIDVGAGDSILLESVDSRGISHYALVDCHDTPTLQSSLIFLKRHFERVASLPDPVDLPPIPVPL
jgi:hypothetical protein